MPSFGNFAVDALSSVISGMNGIGGIIGAFQNKSEPSTSLQNGSFSFLEENHGTKKVDSVALKQQSADLAAMKDFALNIKRWSNEIISVRHSIDSLEFSRMQYILNANANSVATTATPKEDIINIFMKRIINLRDEIAKLQDSCSNAQLQFAIRFSDTDKLKKENLAAMNDSIQKAFDAMAATLQKAYDSMDSGKTTAFLLSLRDILNNASNDYMSMPMTYTGGYVKLTITITPIKKDFSLQSYTSTISFPAFQKTYTGVSSDFFVSGLTNDACSVTGIAGNDTAYKLIKEAPGKLSFGMAASFTGGYRFSQSFAAHLSFGPGVAISNKLSPRLMIGGGLGLGSRNIFSLNGGLIMGYADRLSKVYSDDVNEVFTSKPENTMVSSWKTSWFVSFGYIFSF